MNGGVLVEDTAREGAHEDEKVSSSSLRSRRLGVLLRPVPALAPADMGGMGTGGTTGAFDRMKRPYVIGLTGTSCSGKSTVSKTLQGTHEIFTIDCDKLGHNAYADPNGACYKKVVTTFGGGIVGADGAIDRKELSNQVFGTKAGNRLDDLNAIVWPEIDRVAQMQI